MDVTLIDHNRELGRCPDCGECIEVSSLGCRFCHARFDEWTAREAVRVYKQDQQRASSRNNRRALIYAAGGLILTTLGYALYWGLRIAIQLWLRSP